MRLPVEEWMETSELPEEVRVAFREAVVGFKAGAYRSALLFSYVGWNLAIRHRVLNAQRPERFPEKKWEQIADRLRDDDRWDAQAFETTQMKAPAPIFPVSEDLRTQVRFWKDRRNDCAHFKFNRIGSHHVEAFWSFVQSNLGRFVPAGGEADLLQRLARHYDPNFTPPGADVRPLVDRVPLAVETTRYPQFLSALVRRFSRRTTGAREIGVTELAEIFALLLRGGDPALESAAVEACTKAPSLLTSVLRRDPSLCLRWAADAVVVRRLWRELLFEQGHQDLPIYAALLRNRLIPAEELEEANLWIARRLRGDVPRPEDEPALSQAGFLAALKRIAFEEGQINEFDWGNRNAATVRWYVETYAIDDTVAESICTTFGYPPYPYGGRDALAELFASNRAKLEELEERAEHLDETVPADLVTS